MPRRVSGSPTVAAVERIRRWVHKASSRPPPSAVPETQEILGIGRSDKRLKVRRSEVRNVVTLDSCQYELSDGLLVEVVECTYSS